MLRSLRGDQGDVMKRNPSEYRQYMTSYCVACGAPDTSFNPLDPDHVKTFGAGGENAPWNIMTLCRIHHQDKGSKGVNFMANQFPNYKKWLIDNGWEFDEFRGKWVRYEVNQ